MHTALADFGLTPYTSSAKRRRNTSESTVDVKTKLGRVIRGTNELARDNFVLPPKTVASSLIDLFFEHVFPQYPFLHEPSCKCSLSSECSAMLFLGSYQLLSCNGLSNEVENVDERLSLTAQLTMKPSAVRKRFDSTYTTTQASRDIPWQATLNLVFAFGTDYLDLPLREIYEMSQTFARRATELILSVCFDIATIEVVQALLLLTGHLQSNMQFNKMWTSFGSIVRTARALGLHIDPTSWRISSIEKELRKRLWWGIYAYDR